MSKTTKSVTIDETNALNRRVAELLGIAGNASRRVRRRRKGVRGECL